jgi:hypothetical protein
MIGECLALARADEELGYAPVDARREPLNPPSSD